MKKIYPLVITDKMTQTAAFYKDNFGFVAVFEQDWYIQLLHEKSGCELAFMMPGVESQPPELHHAFTGKGLVLSLEVEDAEAEWQRLKNANLDIIVELRDEPWGQRHFIVADPAGVYVDVVQQLEG